MNSTRSLRWLWIALAILVLLMLAGLLLLRSRPVAPTAATAAAVGATPSPTPNVAYFEAPNRAFRIGLPEGWTPAGRAGQWWLFTRAEPRAEGEPDEVGDLPPVTAQDLEDPYLRSQMLASAPAALGLTYGSLGDPVYDPEDALYRWLVEAEFWLPWSPFASAATATDADDEDAPFTWRTRTVGAAGYPAAEADFLWDTPHGPRQARLTVVKVHDQNWVFLAYAWPAIWEQVQQDLEHMLNTFEPAPNPPPLEAGTPES